MVSAKSAGLAALGFAATATAQLGTARVPTTEFVRQFELSGIVPEVIAGGIDPSVSFYVAYRRDDGTDAVLEPGFSLTVNEAQFPFEFMVENLANASVSFDTTYLIYLLDADAPSRLSPTARNQRHYLQGNFTLSQLQSAVLPSAQRLFVAGQNNFPFTDFITPQPQANTGVHRFIYALYVQPPQFNTIDFGSAGMIEQITNWNLSEWRGQLGLGPAIGATYFMIDTDANNGLGTSQTNVPNANVDPNNPNNPNGNQGIVPPTGPGDAAAGLSAPLLSIAAAGLGAVFAIMTLC